MKIAVFYNLPAGGAKRVVYEELKYLSSMHRVDTFEIKNTSNFLDIGKYVTNRNIYKFSSTPKYLKGILSRFEKDFYELYFLRALHKKIASAIDHGGYDAVLVHPDLMSESPYLLRYLNTPSVYFSHELLRAAHEEALKLDAKYPFPNRVYESLIRYIKGKNDIKNARHADVIATSSEFMKKNIKRIYKRRAKVIKLGVDPDTFKDWGTKRTYFLFIGGRTKVDGYFDVTKAFRSLVNNKKPRLKILGFKDGKADLSNDVKLSKVYSKAIATICFDHNEPFGLKALESMACATPVLAVASGGYLESVKHGVNGYLTKRDSESLGKLIAKLANSPDLVKKLGKAARKDALENWTWNTHNKKLEKLLTKIAQKTNEKI